jgi:hypothetical protein
VKKVGKVKQIKNYPISKMEKKTLKENHEKIQEIIKKIRALKYIKSNK